MSRYSYTVKGAYVRYCVLNNNLSILLEIIIKFLLELESFVYPARCELELLSLITPLSTMAG